MISTAPQPVRPAAQPVTQPAALSEPFLDILIDEHLCAGLPRLHRLWNYYRNAAIDTAPGDAPVSGAVGRRTRVAQEVGLPARLTGRGGDRDAQLDAQQREIVIENDIAWRVHSLVDFMFGKAPTLQSLAAEPQRAVAIERFLRRVFEANGGIAFFQNLGLLGAVYGYVDVLLRVQSANTRNATSGNATDPLQHANRFTLEIIEGPRAVPVLNPSDYRQFDAYVLHYRKQLNEVDQDATLLSKLRQRVLGRQMQASRRASVDCTEVWTHDSYTSYTGGGASGQPRRMTERSLNRLGVIPVVHIQNLPQPFFYEGLSEVEPLIALQDELNTRLSDRANRVTFQAFRMYLGKGIEQFTDKPIGPGQMWATDNLDASIQEFGGDGNSPSEDAHIREIREAMDKTSAVTPVAAGLLQGKVGNLTSENALRITMMGLLAKTEKKRVTYGVGIERICALILQAADTLGIFASTPDERAIRIDWPSPLPENLSQRLRDAQLKLEIGVPRKQVLAELGYADCLHD